jgi:AcrR family transcriptional regulator
MKSQTATRRPTRKKQVSTPVEAERKLPATRKGRERRAQIKAATSDLLRTSSYHDLTLDQITSRVGMPLSVFYHYFDNKRDLVLELLDEVFETFLENVASGYPFGRWENGIYRACYETLRIYDDNAGVMRCLSEVEETEFASRWRDHLWRWRATLARGLSEFASEEACDHAELLAVSHTLSGMVESFAYERFVLQSEPLAARCPDLKTAASFLTTLWIRAAFLGHAQVVDEGEFSTLLGLHELGTSRPTI